MSCVAIDGRLEILDVFDKPQTFGQLWPRLSQGYTLAALPAPHRQNLETSTTESIPTTPEDLLKCAIDGGPEEIETVGAGQTVCINAEGVLGAAGICQDHLAHLSLFTE